MEFDGGGGGGMGMSGKSEDCRHIAPETGAGHGDARCGDTRRVHCLPSLTGSYDAFPLA